MKKQLLLLVLLVFSAGASFASSPRFYEASSEATTPDVDKSYEALVESINDFDALLANQLDSVKTMFPNAVSDDMDPMGGIEATRKGLADILTESKGKYDAKTLTIKEVEKYQSDVEAWKEGMRDVVAQAAMLEFSYQSNEHYLPAYMNLYKAMSDVPQNVMNYFYNQFSEIETELNNAYMEYQVMAEAYATDWTIEKAAAYNKLFDDASNKLTPIVDAGKAAGALVDSITATLDSLDAESAKVKKAFPQYDLSMMQESADYWKNLAAEFTQAPAEGTTPYTEEQIAGFAKELGYFKESVAGLYAQAQKDEWMAQFNAKYAPASEKMNELVSTLDAQCPTVGSKYFTQLDDLNAELSQMYMTLYMGELTQEQFDAMLARIDAILVEAQKIVDEAIEAEKIATGISDITVNKAVKAGNVYSLDGKRVSKSAKGLVIINGKKVVLK